MMHCILMLCVLTVSLLVEARDATASGSAVPGLGGFSSSGGRDTGARQWVELTGTHGLLTGQPRTGSVRLIAISAPGVNHAHLILRELEKSDGTRSLMIVAPDGLTTRVTRATIYLDKHYADSPLLELRDGQWLAHQPQPLRAVLDIDDGPHPLDVVAYTTQGLGFYWFGPAPTIDPPSAASARALLGGSSYRSLLPIVTALLILVAGAILSRWVHRREQP